MRKYYLLVIFQGLLATGFAQGGYDASVVASIKAEEEKKFAGDGYCLSPY